MKTPRIKIALLGLGTVGRATYEHLCLNREIIREKSGVEIDVAWILVREEARHREFLAGRASRLTTDFEAILNDPEVPLLVELMGGTGFAREAVIRALRKGKHVVTANKALMAEHSRELAEVVRETGSSLYFEASVAGGIPIIRTLEHSFSGNRIAEIQGILNGTCNYILTEMSESQKDFDAVLQEAVHKGYAEADPSFDIEGIDAAHKISILAALAFGVLLDFKALRNIEGITRVALQDIRMAERLGFVVRLIARATQLDDGLDIAVLPSLVSRHHPLAAVEGVYNAVFIQASPSGKTMFYGRGAGGDPTASSVLSDIIHCARYAVAGKIQANPLIARPSGEAPLSRTGKPARYYLRIRAEDKPGVLARVAGILGRHNISIATVNQEGGNEDGECVPVFLVTHLADDQALQSAVQEIQKEGTLREKPFVMPIVE